MAIDFPNSPSDNDIYTVNGKRWIYSSGKWSIYGSTAPDATASDTEPTGVGDGHIWYRSDESQTLIRYDNTWVEVGSAGGFDNASTSFPTSLDSATGFAAVEALQAKVGVNGSAVTTSHEYRINSIEELNINNPLTSYTLALTDGGKLVQPHSASANDLTIPPNSSVAFPVGTQILVVQVGAGQVTLVEGSGVLIESKDGNKKLSGQFSAVTLIQRATDVWLAIGDLSA